MKRLPFVLVVVWRDYGEKELRFSSHLEAKRQQESMQEVFGARICRMEILERRSG